MLLTVLLVALLLFAACGDKQTVNTPSDDKNQQDDTVVTPVNITLPGNIKKITVTRNGDSDTAVSFTRVTPIKRIADHLRSAELVPINTGDLDYDGGYWSLQMESESGTVSVQLLGNRFLHMSDGESGKLYQLYNAQTDFEEVLKANTPDILPKKFDDIALAEWKIPSKISIYRDGGSTPDFAYITDRNEILLWYDCFKAESLIPTSELLWGSSEQERYYIDFGNGYALTVYADDKDFFCCLRGESVQYNGESVSMLIENTQTYTVGDEAQQKLKELFLDEQYPAPDKVVMYYYGKKKEITEPADIEWWYNALKNDALTPDGTIACRCGPVYFIDFGNGYAVSAHAHANAYHVGTGISVAGSTAGLLGDTLLAYSVPESVHQKLEDLFK